MSARRARPILQQSLDGYTPVVQTNAQGVTGPVLLDGTNAIITSFYSVPIWVDPFDSFRFQFTCPATGSPSGTLVLQATLDEVSSVSGAPNAAELPAANWAPLSFSVNGGAFASSYAVAGATQIVLDENRCNYAWIRMLYTLTSGQVTPTGKMRLKGVDGR